MSSYYQLDFEKPLAELDQQLEAVEARLRSAHAVSQPASPGELESIQAELAGLADRRAAELARIYSNLTPWQTVRVARHPQRPQTRDYIAMLCRDFAELHGDRRYGDDPAIVCGFARFGHTKVMLIGHQKGRETAEKISCHFGCAHPEGYRKALRCMKLAAKYRLPIVTLVDTPGAYPGLGAEQRGQAEAIALNLLEMSRLPTPIVSVVIGEGGSGGALGIAVADRVAMLQHAWYSVISPEGCAAILWKEANERTTTEAARALKLTASDNLAVGIIDAVLPEPVGGAHRDPRATAATLQTWVLEQVASLAKTPTEDLLSARYDRFRKMGSFLEFAEPAGASA